MKKINEVTADLVECQSSSFWARVPLVLSCYCRLIIYLALSMLIMKQSNGKRKKKIRKRDCLCPILCEGVNRRNTKRCQLPIWYVQSSGKMFAPNVWEVCCHVGYGVAWTLGSVSTKVSIIACAHWFRWRVNVGTLGLSFSYNIEAEPQYLFPKALL